MTSPAALAAASVTSAVALLTDGPPERQEVFVSRARTVLNALGPDRWDGEGAPALAGALESVLARADPEETWLVLAVMSGRLPLVPEVEGLVRAGRLGRGPAELCRTLQSYGELWAAEWPAVEVVTDTVVVDLHHTARNIFATGIQRVSREAARRWRRDHDVVLLGWTTGYYAFRRLSEQESAVALDGRSPTGERPTPAPTHVRRQAVVVPWRCVHIVPELPAEPERGPRYQGFVAYSRCHTGLVGHDCVPIMAAETCAEGMSLGFALYLAAAARVDRIATVSRTAAVEYKGWRTMLAGAGLAGPQIEAIPNAVEARPSTADEMETAKKLIGIGSMPVVLCVGSHEPRKNHMPLLHAAEVLWREGVEFTLTFIGGNSWKSDRFTNRVAELYRRNRPLQVILALSDELLWAAYRVAYCTVFPSLHEGFGLPVAESLASGTPVVTANYGSMRECAAGGGALLFDPRDDAQLTDALRRILTEPGLRDRLAHEAAAVKLRSWDDYAAETWAYFVDGTAPVG